MTVVRRNGGGTVVIPATDDGGVSVDVAVSAYVPVDASGNVLSGGGGGGGGGGAVTAADGALVTIGTTTDAATTTTLIGLTKALLNALNAPTPAGTNVIGAITSPTLLAAINAPTPAGANAIGTVGVTAVVNPADVVTTPTINTGTVNTFVEFPSAGADGVSLEIASLPAGAVLSFQRRVGSTVYNATALPAGAGNVFTGSTAASGVFHFLGGGQYIRLTVTTAAAGTANLTWVGSAGLDITSVKQSNRANLLANASLQIAGVDNAVGNPVFAKITDGTNSGTVKAANTPAVAGDTAQVVSNRDPISLAVAANFTPTQVSVGTSATLIVAARAGRQSVTIYNSSAVTVYLGGSGVTPATGQFLPAGGARTIQTSAAIYGVVATGTATVGADELY